MLYTRPIKSIRDIPSAEYNSVMSRHTKDDGITLDPTIDLMQVNHLVDLAPPAKLVGDWYRGRLGAHNSQTFRDHFEPRYLDYLDSRTQNVRNLGESALTQEVVIMCIEPTVDTTQVLLCHRRLLAQACMSLVPGLRADIK